MSRMPLTTVDQQSEPIREFVARRGELNLFRLLAHAPAVFVGWAQMVDEILDSPTFTPRMRELGIVRVAHLRGAPSAHGPGPLCGRERTTDQRRRQHR